MDTESLWPNLFVVGAAKAGTTSLWRYLGEHPDVFMTYFKEPHFFSGHRLKPFPVVHDEGAYLRLFAGARARFRGEAKAARESAQAADRPRDRRRRDGVLRFRRPGAGGLWVPRRDPR